MVAPVVAFMAKRVELGGGTGGVTLLGCSALTTCLPNNILCVSNMDKIDPKKSTEIHIFQVKPLK